MADPVLKKVVAASAIGAVASCAAIAGVGLLAIPEAQRSPWFWPRMAWVNVLTIIAWIALTIFFAQISRRVRRIEGFGGVAPTVTYFLLYFVVSGYLGVFMSSYVLDSGAWEVASQLYNTAGLIISAVLLYFSWLGATADATRPPDGVAPPSVLARQLRQAELRLGQGSASAPELARQIQRLREFVQYSLPDLGPFAASETYVRFAQDVQVLIDDLGSAARGEPRPGAETGPARVENLLSSAAHCAASLKD